MRLGMCGIYILDKAAKITGHARVYSQHGLKPHVRDLFNVHFPQFTLK
jgi:hypothetical protein